MTITIRKNIGDTIFFLLNGKIRSLSINSIKTETESKDSKLETKIEYWVKVPKGDTDWEYKIFKEIEIFDSREQLIESL